MPTDAYVWRFGWCVGVCCLTGERERPAAATVAVAFKRVEHIRATIMGDTFDRPRDRRYWVEVNDISNFYVSTGLRRLELLQSLR